MYIENDKPKPEAYVAGTVNRKQVTWSTYYRVDGENRKIKANETRKGNGTHLHTHSGAEKKNINTIQAICYY